MRGFFATLIVLIANIVAGAQTVDGRRVVWHPITITFEGPQAAETDDAPNPFLDLRLQVVFTGPDNQLFVVPGFFDGDGKGGSSGKAWRVRFTPNVAGKWRYEASFPTVLNDPASGSGPRPRESRGPRCFSQACASNRIATTPTESA